MAILDPFKNASTSQKVIFAIVILTVSTGFITRTTQKYKKRKQKQSQIQSLRNWFPFFKSHPRWAFFENAGGSQVPFPVIENITNYYTKLYVQLGAGYEISNESDAIIQKCRDFEGIFLNATNVGKVILGPSTSILVEQLANSFTNRLKADDEIIVSMAAHESNKGPWTKLAQRTGAIVKQWHVNDQTWETCPLDSLLSILNSKTKLVAFPHVSNILGEVVDVKRIVFEIKSRFPTVVVCVDGVAYAPHGLIDVQDFDVDWYVYSVYKVFGPHFASMFGTFEAFKTLTGPNHYFINNNEIPYKFELGGVCHELCAGRLGIVPYLQTLAGNSDEFTRQTVVDAFSTIEKLEIELTKKVYDFLLQWSDVKVYSSSGLKKKVPTISFTHKFYSSAEIVAHLHKDYIACRNGHMYAHSLVCGTMGLGTDGVVRISLLHYNTIEEVDRLIDSLSRFFLK